MIYQNCFIWQAVCCFPMVAAAHWADEDALLVACHGASQPLCAPADLLRPWTPFAAVWDAYVAAAGAQRMSNSKHA